LKKDILIVNTGGTFNKEYNPVSGDNVIDPSGFAITDLFDKWLCNYKVINIIGKDSLEFTDLDRDILKDTIDNCDEDFVIVVHGTDTMDISAKYVDRLDIDKTVIFTGSMVPYSFDPVEATANLACAIGYFYSETVNTGVLISMHGLIQDHTFIRKDRLNGVFISTES